MTGTLYDPDGDPPLRLEAWLTLHLRHYEHEFNEYWGADASTCPSHLSFEDWRDVHALSSSFQSLLGSLKELALNPRVLKYAESQIEFGNPLRALPDLAADQYVRDRLQIAMADDALIRLDRTSIRASFLTHLLGRTRLSEFAQGYVRRTTELYLWGFDLEAMIMASCVLEQALARELVDTPLEQFGLRRESGQPDWSYWQLIDGAAKLGVFSEDQRQKAHGLRQLRNQLLHDIPASDEPIEEVLWDLYQLLAALSPGRGHLDAE